MIIDLGYSYVILLFLGFFLFRVGCYIGYVIMCIRYYMGIRYVNLDFSIFLFWAIGFSTHK